MSDRVAAYAQVADALSTRLADAPVYALEGDRQRAQAVIAKLREDRRSAVVAIGSFATRWAVTLSPPERPIIFCQDFTPTDASLPAGVRGVHAIPPAQKQLQAWKMVDPRLQRVVIITGPGRDELVREAAAAARQTQVRLQHMAVRSDRELLYAVKRLDADVQGLWFVPDNRVLSTEVLRTALAHGLRQGKQALVFSPQLLDFGALLSVEGDPPDIAERVLEQLHPEDAALPQVAPLRRARVQINTQIARQLGLAVPQALQTGPYVF